MSDASVVFIGHRALTGAPSLAVYHLPARHHYGYKTRCGIVIWSDEQPDSTVVPIRRDFAERIARVCGKCQPANEGG